MDEFIPVNTPLLAGNEKKYLNECIDTGWISSEGPFVKAFEEQFADRVGRQHGVSVTSGTAALECAVRALDLAPGDEVILPTFSIISCIQSIIRNNLVPVLVDCEPDTWNMNALAIKQKITNKTKAILVVHTYGLPVQMDDVLAIAKKHKLKVIEDAAEMHGQTYNGKPCGSFGDISIFSFYPNKLVTTGEGGMIVTDDATLFERCCYFRNLAFENPRFVHHNLGYNFRMSNIQAAIGLAQLERIDDFIDIKREMGAHYQRELQDIDSFQLPIAQTNYAENIYWVFALVSRSIPAVQVTKKLAQAKIGTRPFFYPMHLQPVFKNEGRFVNELYPVSERIGQYGFYLPSGLALKRHEIQKVCEAVKKIDKILINEKSLEACNI